MDCRPGNIMLFNVTSPDSDNYTLVCGKVLLFLRKSHWSGGKGGTASDTLKWLIKMCVGCVCAEREGSNEKANVANTENCEFLRSVIGSSWYYSWNLNWNHFKMNIFWKVFDATPKETQWTPHGVWIITQTTRDAGSSLAPRLETHVEACWCPFAACAFLRASLAPRGKHTHERKSAH